MLMSMCSLSLSETRHCVPCHRSISCGASEETLTCKLTLLSLVCTCAQPCRRLQPHFDACHPNIGCSVPWLACSSMQRVALLQQRLVCVHVLSTSTTACEMSSAGVQVGSCTCISDSCTRVLLDVEVHVIGGHQAIRVYRHDLCLETLQRITLMPCLCMAPLVSCAVARRWSQLCSYLLGHFLSVTGFMWLQAGKIACNTCKLDATRQATALTASQCPGGHLQSQA